MKSVESKVNTITLESGKTYNLLVGIHVAGCGDVIYLSNMLCTDVTDDEYVLKGVPGTVGSMRGPISVYKDEVFAVFERDMYECLNH